MELKNEEAELTQCNRIRSPVQFEPSSNLTIESKLNRPISSSCRHNISASCTTNQQMHARTRLQTINCAIWAYIHCSLSVSDLSCLSHNLSIWPIVTFLFDPMTAVLQIRLGQSTQQRLRDGLNSVPMLLSLLHHIVDIVSDRRLVPRR